MIELLEYCDEYEEESQEGSSDKEMEDGGVTLAERRPESD